MNAPDRFELFVIPEGRRKVEMEVDTKIPNAATFKIEREDHTLANMLRTQLLKDPRVLFAGYKVPHPLEHNFLIKVQTVPGTAPGQALKDATSELISEINTLKNKFDMDVIRHRTFEDAKATQSGMGAFDAGEAGRQPGGLDPTRPGMDLDF
ncbi:DNA-directed RNA polymerase [Zychaea mexicana]|uniref:DNA-directed RNA polymerase n=1 Tax=Zychaea mexicana TaxID=64656 RepID=UPI0022FDE57D|nr:DNA-directed RNA polymerase [Zychaea mexicana]KAI9489310.1 DNA-directed RNA polymerase [Zychaea mexicana]